MDTFLSQLLSKIFYSNLSLILPSTLNIPSEKIEIQYGPIFNPEIHSLGKEIMVIVPVGEEKIENPVMPHIFFPYPEVPSSIDVNFSEEIPYFLPQLLEQNRKENKKGKIKYYGFYNSEYYNSEESNRKRALFQKALDQKNLSLIKYLLNHPGFYYNMKNYHGNLIVAKYLLYFSKTHTNFHFPKNQLLIQTIKDKDDNTFRYLMLAPNRNSGFGGIDMYIEWEGPGQMIIRDGTIKAYKEYLKYLNRIEQINEPDLMIYIAQLCNIEKIRYLIQYLPNFTCNLDTLFSVMKADCPIEFNELGSQRDPDSRRELKSGKYSSSKEYREDKILETIKFLFDNSKENPLTSLEEDEPLAMEDNVLYGAAGEGLEKVFDFLITKFPERIVKKLINMEYLNEYNTLIVAIDSGNLNIVKKLIIMGVDPAKNSYLALRKAIEEDKKEIVKYLLKFYPLE